MRNGTADDTVREDGSEARGSKLRALGQVALGAALLGAGIGHLTVAREEFQAQVPGWFPIDEDVTVLASGVVEIGLGGLLLAVWKQPWRARVGLAAAAFFVAIFPGNIAQYLEGKDGFCLDTDAKRLARLPFQAVLIGVALWGTDARSLRRKR